MVVESEHRVPFGLQKTKHTVIFRRSFGGCISPHFINWNYKIMSDLVCKGGVFVCCFLVSINTSIDDTVTLLSPNSAFDLIVPFNNLKHYKYDTKESKTGIN